MSHKARIAYHALAPEAAKALIALSGAVRQGPLDAHLIDLVWLRISQVNGCTYCIDMHWRDLVKADADPRRLNALVAWEEAPFFDARERAALRWSDIVTRSAGRDASDAEFAALQEHFSEAEIAQLGFAISCMNAWNRMGISFRQPVPANAS